MKPIMNKDLWNIQDSPKQINNEAFTHIIITDVILLVFEVMMFLSDHLVYICIYYLHVY